MARTNIVKQRRVGEAAAAANGPKHELMGIATRLSAAAPPRKAVALFRIIARLERWQNTP